MIPLETILNKNTNYKSNSLKERLFKSGIKEAKCEICGDTECLELHHINGDHHDNRLENLQILCIKCHYKTPNYRGKNKKRNDDSLLNLYIKKEKPLCTCLNCGKEFYSDRSDKERKFCNRECYNQYLKKSSNPILIKEDILKVIDNYSDITNLGKHFSVSRTTMRKYLEMFNLLDKFKLKYEFNTKKLQQYDLNMNLIKEWPSIVDAEETLGITGISKVANGKRRSCGGFIWRFID